MAPNLSVTVYFISIIILLKIKTIRAVENGTCEDLHSEELAKMYRDWVGDDRHLAATFYIHPALAEQLHSLSPSRPTKSTTLFRALMLGNRHCPKAVDSKSRSIMESSTCPWYLELTGDKFRFPMYLANARCKCNHCIGMGRYPMEDEESKCKAIVVKEKVLRRPVSTDGNPGCMDGKAVYDKTYADVTIGCTCIIRSKTKQSSTKSRP